MRSYSIISAILFVVTAVAYPRQAMSIQALESSLDVETNTLSLSNFPIGSLINHPPPRFKAALDHDSILEVTIHLTTTIILTQSVTSLQAEQPTIDTITISVIKTLTSTVWESTILDTTQNLNQDQYSSNTERPIQCIVNSTSLPIFLGKNSSAFQTFLSTASSIATPSTLAYQQMNSVQSVISGTNTSQQWSSNKNSTTSSIATLSTVTSQQPSNPQSDISGLSLSSSFSISTAQQLSSNQGETFAVGSSGIPSVTISFITVSQSLGAFVSGYVQESREIPGTNAGLTLVVTPFLSPP